ncbi:MAG: hypothetical protein LBT45_01330 [Rickettsiales bacterium]|jgi:hypothetical protein|nr:hypothetical protein [Rickettsiales bacterium]
MNTLKQAINAYLAIGRKRLEIKQKELGKELEVHKKRMDEEVRSYADSRISAIDRNTCAAIENAYRKHLDAMEELKQFEEKNPSLYKKLAEHEERSFAFIVRSHIEICSNATRWIRAIKDSR